MKQAQVLSEKEIRYFISYLKTKPFYTRNKAMFMIGILTGMRVGEISSLYVSDVIGINNTIRDEIILSPKQTKGNQHRSVILNNQAQSIIRDYILENNLKPSSPLFQSKYGKKFSPNSLCQVFSRHFKASGLDAATSHSSRRTFITNLANKGINVRVIAALSGHQSISTTQRYIDFNPSILRNAVELL